MPTGYSKTPLTKKLGIKTGFKLLLRNTPDHYFDLLLGLPEDTVVLEDLQPADFIHLFCTHSEELSKLGPLLKSQLKKDGLMWISWPKGKSKIPTDLNRELIREHGLGIGLVDVKVAAIDEDWSGLKFVYRLTDR